MVIYTISSLIFPSFVSLIIDRGVAVGNSKNIVVYSIAMLLVGIVMMLFQYLQRYGFFELAQKITIGIKKKLMKQLMKTNLEFWNEHKIGDMFTVLESDVSRLETVLSNVISEILVNAVVVVGITGYLIYIDYSIGIIVFVIALIFAALQHLVGKKVENEMYRLREVIGDLSSDTNEILNNINNIQASNYSNVILDKYSSQMNQVKDKSVRQFKSMSLTQIVGVAFNILGIFVVLLIGSYRVSTESMSIGILFSLTIYVQRVYGPVVGLANIYISIRNALPIISKIEKVMNTDKIIEGGNLKYNHQLKGDINFDHISFSYGKDKPNIINDLSLVIHSGEICGIIGENGSGKTTLLKLLAKSYNLGKGKIQIDDNNIDEYQLEYLRSQFGYMLQNTFLMSGKLRDILNPLKLEKEDCEILKMMELFELDINKFNHGLDTEIGENKINISGGEAQKISLIRLFLEDKPIYILDEPTAAIDVESEEMICSRLKQLLKGKTGIIITHREKILDICDNVIQLA